VKEYNINNCLVRLYDITEWLMIELRKDAVSNAKRLSDFIFVEHANNVLTIVHEAPFHKLPAFYNNAEDIEKELQEILCREAITNKSW